MPLPYKSMPQEFAPADQLGALEGEYIIDPKKILASYGRSLASVLAIFVIMLFLFHLIPSIPTRGASPNDLSGYFALFLICFLLAGVYYLGCYFYYQHLHISVYANGLVYHKRTKWRVIYWQQVKRVSGGGRGRNLGISVHNEPFLVISAFVSRFDELHARVTLGMASHRHPD